MKQIIKWVAFDGEEFETKEECCEHEEPIREFRNFIIKNISMYDSEHRDLLEGLNIEDDEETFYVAVEYAYNQAKHLTIRMDMNYEISSHLWDTFGYSDIPPKAGTYRYDDDTNTWHSLKEDVLELAELWDIGLDTLNKFITAL